MAAPELQFDTRDYSQCNGLDVKIDTAGQVAYLTIDRGLELPVKVAIAFGPICLLAAGVLQALAAGPQESTGQRSVA